MTGKHLAQIMRRAASALLIAALAALLALPDARPAFCAAEAAELEKTLAELEKTLGPDHLDVAKKLNGFGVLQLRQGRYEQAEPFLQLALAIREKALGPNHPDYAESLNNMASLYHIQGQYEKAEPLYQRALAIWEKQLGPEHPHLASSLNNLASLYQRQGQYEKAEPLFQRALAIREKQLGPYHPDTAISLNNLAELYTLQAQYAQAEPLYQRALAILEKQQGPDHPHVAGSLQNLASLHYKQGQYAKAEPLLQRALAIFEKTLGPEHPDVAVSLNNLAILYNEQGQYAKAEPLFQRALAIRVKQLGPEHPDVALSLESLASLYESQAQYVTMEPLVKRALEIREKALGPEHPDVAKTLQHLAGQYIWQARYADAEPLFQRALAIQEKALGPEHPDTANCLNMLALLYERQAQYAEAEPLFKRTLEIREKALGPNHPVVAQSLQNLASLHYKQAQYEKSEPLYKRALPIAEAAGQPELLWIVQGHLRALYAESNPNLAVFYGKRAVNTLQEVRASNTQMDMTLQRLFLRSNESAYAMLADLLFSQNRLAEGQQVLDMLKEAEYHEFSGKSAENDPRRSRATYSPREAKWDTRFRELSEKLQAADAASPEYEAAQKDFDAFFEEVKAAFAPDAPGEPNRLDNAGPLQKPLAELGEGVVLVQYLMPRNRLWLLLTTKGGMKARRVDIEAEALKERITAFRCAIVPKIARSESEKELCDAIADKNPDVTRLSQELHDHLIKPAADDLKTAKTLMLAPDGALRYLPFAALHDGEKYLVERYTLANFTDMTKEHITDRPKPDWTFAGFGVSRAVGGHLALPVVKKELEDIHDKVLPGEIRLDEQFTRQALQDALKQSPPVVHLATHFKFAKGDERASYLLTGDGRLTLAEIRGGFRFDGADLVALSACETAMGGGADENGREVEGLGVLAQRQGAKGVLASLWPVNDASTGQLMRLFYGYRQQAGLSKAEALQKAQLAFIEGRVDAALAEVDRNRGRVPAGERVGAPVTAQPARSSDPAHPYFWAPFILMGNWL